MLNADWYGDLSLLAVGSGLVCLLAWVVFKASHRRLGLANSIARVVGLIAVPASIAALVLHLLQGHYPGSAQALAPLRFITEHPLPLLAGVVSAIILYRAGLPVNRIRRH